eukprot:CAMPEP_0171196864 /NCGR_PEP_ID=MMETSP0790-20130122/22121_1 /TAXON_ID=2925 /ORGANISM="Alexandrium catenella, Strain OF101" /LENGTH=426 /DNA_ID=CAMNT_0011662099 /DNA_START=1 /DNA_END=1281 /DNA_ORIENTATION=+
MLMVCSHIGRGLNGADDPKNCLDVIMPAVTAWGAQRLGTKGFGGLYKKVSGLTLAALKAEGLSECTGTHTFRVTREQLTENVNCGVVIPGAVHAAKLELTLSTNDRETSHFGVYLRPLSFDHYPPWWGCSLVYSFLCEGFKQEESSSYVGRHTFHRASLGMGCPEFLAHDRIPEPPADAGPLGLSDVVTELCIRAHVAINPLASLCSSYAFFHPEPSIRESSSLWSSLQSADVVANICLDSLPVKSEDIVLELLLARPPPELGSLLPYLRWEYLSVDALLGACRHDGFRRCELSREALTWLTIPGTSLPAALTGKRCSIRREHYAADVKSNYPLPLPELIRWLLGGIDSELSGRCSAEAKKASEAERRAAKAESKLRKLEAEVTRLRRLAGIEESGEREPKRRKVAGSFTGGGHATRKCWADRAAF